MTPADFVVVPSVPTPVVVPSVPTPVVVPSVPTPVVVPSAPTPVVVPSVPTPVVVPSVPVVPTPVLLPNPIYDVNINKENKENKDNKENKKSNYGSKTKRSGLILSVPRVERNLRKGYRGRVGKTASIYLAGALEFLIADMIHVAAEETLVGKRKRITERDINLGVQKDGELKSVLSHVIIPNSGVLPVFVRPKKKRKKNKKNDEEVKDFQIDLNSEIIVK
jgi:histone H2A